jgi:hypothetical protein
VHWRVYIRKGELIGRNLAVWARNWDFFDPEPVNIEGRTRNASGNFVNDGIAPMVSFFTVGLDITL